MAKTRDWEKNPVDETELVAFLKVVQGMADKAFGVDDEGDSSVIVELVDRTRYQGNHFTHVPYGHRSEAGRKAAFEAAVRNLGVAYGAFDTENQIRLSCKERA
jgi:hypothetical protein